MVLHQSETSWLQSTGLQLRDVPKPSRITSCHSTSRTASHLCQLDNESLFRTRRPRNGRSKAWSWSKHDAVATTSNSTLELWCGETGSFWSLYRWSPHQRNRLNPQLQHHGRRQQPHPPEQLQTRHHRCQEGRREQGGSLIVSPDDAVLTPDKISHQPFQFFLILFNLNPHSMQI